MHRPALSVVGVTLMALVSSSCGGAGAFPERPSQVTITMREYQFDVRGPVKEGRVVVTLDNTGTVEHQLSLVQLAEDVPPLDEQLRGERRRGAPTLVLLLRPPGTTTRFAVDLARGRYGLVCLLPAPDGVQHALKGMNREIRAG